MTHAQAPTLRITAAAILLPALALLAACGGAPGTGTTPPVAPAAFVCGAPAQPFASLPRGSDAGGARQLDLDGVVVASFRRGLGGFVLQSAPPAPTSAKILMAASGRSAPRGWVHRRRPRSRARPTTRN
jgi:hypothetical protein